MSEPGDELSRRYRALGQDEPPPAIDAAVLAASRRAVGARPGRRWAGPISIAAVLVLGIGVSLRMQVKENSALEAPPRADAPAVEAPVPKPVPAPTPASPPLPPVAIERAASPPLRVAPAQRATAADANTSGAQPKAEVASGQVANPSVMETVRAKRDTRVQTGPMRGLSHGPDVAEVELERIVRLREAGRDGDADQALEDFVRRRPDHRIPDAMQQRLKRR